MFIGFLLLPQVQQNNNHSSSHMVPTPVSSLHSQFSIIRACPLGDLDFLSSFLSSFLPLLLLLVLPPCCPPFRRPPCLLLPSHYLPSSFTFIQQRFQQWTPTSVMINPSCPRDLTFCGCLDLHPSLQTPVYLVWGPIMHHNFLKLPE